ncbi:hypothetical protein [Staphylococcus epidermidis]|nr:hypothetical protein [Staphylococcus epidermidis]
MNIGGNWVVLECVGSYRSVVGIGGEIVKEEGRGIGKRFDEGKLGDGV